MKKLLLLILVLSGTIHLMAQTKSTFTIKNSKSLPAWFENAERTYTLNDDRIVEAEEIQYIGGFNPNKGEVFFIDNKEVVFSDSQIKINKVKNVITKTFTSGDYVIKISWDTTLSTGEYSEGKVTLTYKNINQFKSPLIISGM